MVLYIELMFYIGKVLREGRKTDAEKHQDANISNRNLAYESQLQRQLFYARRKNTILEDFTMNCNDVAHEV